MKIKNYLFTCLGLPAVLLGSLSGVLPKEIELKIKDAKNERPTPNEGVTENTPKETKGSPEKR